MNFTTLFPETENVHLIKDVGMIPYIMYKEYNYNSKVVCYKNGDYLYLKDEVRGLDMEFIKNYTNKALIDGAIYLFNNSKKIDILQLYHLDIKAYVYAFIYKLVNRKGQLYIKLDADEDAIIRMTGKRKGIKYKIKEILTYLFVKYNIIDFLSIETKENYDKLVDYNKNLYKDKLFYLPNGILINNFPNINKKNIILTVGRLGTYEKATEILLEAFANLKEIKDWKLILIGPIEESFKDYINKYYQRYPNLLNQVIFVGNIADRYILYKYYSEAKIFCLPSRYESFGIALIEAAFFGDYIVSTDVGGAKDILNETNYGSLINVDDIKGLSQTLQNLINDWDKYKKDPIEIQNIVADKFNWVKLCKIIDEKIKNK
ncbi:glycosyltransferase involved in cell wall biosynthesis [Thermohydrogenium kirishiense]|nr:glycosyltransferase involved in cell wall biosynthesis [Thermohydrogenium kirishiense]